MPYHQGYGDPLHELIGKESKTCKGCIHQSTEKAFGILINYCKLGRKNMIRCANYKEKNNEP